MFPACILFGLAELLIPELARCAAAGSTNRIQYLAKRSLRLAMVYGMFFGGLLFLLSDSICLWLYNSTAAAAFLRMYSLLIPMLYCDAITDAMTKGLGQQKACVRYNIITSALDVVCLYMLLPHYGMMGYFASFFLTHVINFLLSLRRLLKITEQHIPFHIPASAVSAAVVSIVGATGFSNPLLRAVCFGALLASLLYLTNIIRKEDLAWVKGLLRSEKICRAGS